MLDALELPADARRRPRGHGPTGDCHVRHLGDGSVTAPHGPNINQPASGVDPASYPRVQCKLTPTEIAAFIGKILREVPEGVSPRSRRELIPVEHKDGVHAFIAAFDNLTSNRAYMMMASLAWSLKAWSALLVFVHGRWKEKHELEKKTLLKMDFVTFCNAMIAIPAQIIIVRRLAKQR